MDASSSRDPSGARKTRLAPRPGVAVPSWYDLPLLLPDTDPVLGRLQRSHLETLGGDDAAGMGGEENRGFVVPKVSRLSPNKESLRKSRTLQDVEREKNALMQQHRQGSWRREGNKMVLKPRKTTQGGAAVVLDRLHQDRSQRRRDRLRDKIWKDLDRFGVWYIGGRRVCEDADHEDTAKSVDATVESIMKQWNQNVENSEIEEFVDEQDEYNDDTSAPEPASGTVFLTAVPGVSSVRNDRRSSVPTETPLPAQNTDEAPESDVDGADHYMDDEEDEEQDDKTQDMSLAARFRKEIQAPGLKRRQRLKDLHVFVEKQLQKRLYRSWDTIEIALSGSGDLSVNQIVKFLQNSDVKLSVLDASKVQSILHKHLEAQHAAKLEAEHAAAAAAAAVQSLTSDNQESLQSNSTGSALPKNSKLSYAVFRKIFQPRDKQDAARWKREYDRDKVRLRQEKEIYERELASLEEKVKKRLAESAKQMVELLDNFHCDPLSIPWASEAQRLELRAQFLRIIFSKPARRRLSQAGAAITASIAAAGLGGAPGSELALLTPIDVPEKLSVPPILSALLQKYSRNGHFESIEVPVAAYLFHDVAADVIKASIQAFWKRCEADLWPERQLIFKHRLRKAVFFEWKRFTKHAEVLRKHILRKFVAWAYWTRKLHEYYAFFRACFWPFYVWKRELQRMIIARGKSVFLRNVVLTYIQLRNFRAWKAYYRKKCWYRKQVRRLRKKKAKQLIKICWNEWFGRLRVHLQIYRLWRSKGHVLQRLHKGYMVKLTFFVWRYYSILKQDMAARQYKCFHSQYPPIGTSRQHSQHTPQSLYSSGVISFSPSRFQTQTEMHSPSRGVSWNPSAGIGAGLQGTRSTSMAPVYGQKGGIGASESLDDGVDGFVNEEDGEDDGDSNSHSPPDVRSLSKIMETDLAPRIKRKSRLYDLCLNLYLRFRERDRRDLTGNIILFRRVGRAFLNAMKVHVSYKKKNRMATDLGAFRHLYRRFRWWVAVAVYKNPLVKQDSSLDDKENASHLPNTDSNLDDDTTGLERKADAVELDWKRDTEWRHTGLMMLSVDAEKLQQDLVAIAEQQARRIERMQDLEIQLRERKRQEDVFLRKEAGATLKVRALQMQQAQQILRTRGHRLHDVLDRAFDSLRAQQRIQQLKSSFRGLRVALMLRCTITLCHRAQLRNWLRICRKFTFWQQNATRFHTLRVKFHAFRTLLRFVVFKWKHESPGLSARLAHRQQLLRKYETYLDTHGLLNGSASAQRIALTKYSPANTFHGVFLRWVQFTQLAKTYNEVVDVVQRKHELWQLHSVFQTLKIFVKAKYTVEARRRTVPFLWRQCMADLDALHCKILALRARLPSERLRRLLRLTQRHLQQAATGAPTLKQLFQRHEQEIRQRLFLESRLMFVAYSERRVHNYAERSSPLFGAPVGRAFAYEKAPAYGSISDVVLLCGKKLDAVSLVLKTNAAVTVESQLHGNPFGNREVFSLARGEKLVLIEGYASQTLYGLRFGTSTGRLSKWFGHCEKGTKFELRADWSKREEIVGLFGYADATSLHALGCVFRHTTLRNIFEGMWLQPAKADIVAPSADGTPSPPQTSGTDGVHASPQPDMSLCDRQFAYFVQVRMCDVLLAMKRSHRLALRVHRMAHALPPPLSRKRVVLGLMRWLFDALAHGLVRSSDREEEGKRVLQDGMNKRAAGEKALEEGARLLAEVDGFRDSDKQLNIATLGAKKVAELNGMVEQGEAKLVLGKRLLDEGQAEILRGRHVLPHVPMTRRMMTAIRRMYKVVQTKDYIDQMDPSLRAILLEGESGASQPSIFDPM